MNGRLEVLKGRLIENPVMHNHARALIQPVDVQFVQPWWFGDPYFKATGFERRGLPELVADRKLAPPKAGTAEHKRWSRVHRMPPSQDRARLRSETFPGMARAIARQMTAAILGRAA